MNKYKKNITLDKTEKKILKQKIKQSTIMADIFKPLLFSTLSVILCVMLVFGYFLYRQGVDYSNILMKEEANTVSSNADSYLNTIQNNLNILLALPEVIQGSEVEARKPFLLELLASIEQHFPFIDQVLIGYENNTLIVNDEVDIDKYVVTTRPWYKNALKNPDSLTIGCAHHSERTGKDVFLISKAIMDNGEVKGVISINCQLDSLYQIFINNFKYSSKSTFIASPTTDFKFGRTFSELDEKLLNAHPELLNEETNLLNIKLGKEKYLLYSHRLPECDWTLVTRINYSEIINPVLKRVGCILLFLLLITIIISYIVAKALSKSIAKPVIEVSSALANFAKNDEKIKPIQVKQNNEIGLMAQSFNAFIKNTESLKSDIRGMKDIQSKLSSSLSLVNASLESTNDGVMIVDNDGIAKKWNNKLLEIWEITSLEINEGKNDLLSQQPNNKIIKIEPTINTIDETLINPEKNSLDVLKLNNGRVVERSSFPQKIADQVVGRVWRFKDVTENRKIEAELIVREQNFRELFESLREMVFVVDFKANIVYTNKSTTTELGYSLEELAKMTMFDLHEKEFVEEARSHFKKIIKGERFQTFTSLIAKNGYKIPTDISVWLGKWDEEDFVFLIVKNISKEQEALIKFNKVFENNPSLMVLTTYPEQIIIDVNEMFCRTLELKKEEVIGKNVDEIEVIRTSQTFDKNIEIILNQNTFKNVDIELTSKSGKKIEGLLAGELIKVNNKSFYLAVVTNITEVKKLNRDLEKSEQRYRLLFENMTSGFALHEMIYDEAGKAVDYRFLIINPVFKKMMGCNEKHLIGKSIKEAFPQMSDYLIETYGKVVRTGETISFERYSQTFGRYFEIKAFSTEQGKFVTILTDVTERMSFLAALEKEKELAQAATEAKSEFLANMSHEIRTPLNGVIGFTDLLLQTELNQTQRQYVINANVSGKALLSIINDILDFSKIESGRMELDFVNANLVEVVEQVTDIVKFSSCEKGIDLIVDIPVDFPEIVKVDPLRLRQMLLNLLNNAVKFTHKGYVDLILSFTPKENNRGKFTFKVKDTGIGIAEEVSSKLFQAFSQADGSITRKYGGTGLGLVISNYFATKMGSQIEFESEVGVGSEFFFTIETDYLENSGNLKNTLSNNKIFVLEQNQKIIDVVERYLEYWGMQVDTTNDNETALKKLDSKEYDVLLIDFRMLKQNDFKILQTLKNRDKTAYEHQTTIFTYCPGDADNIIKEKNHLLDKQKISKPIIMKNLYNLLFQACNNKDKPKDKKRKSLRSKRKALLPEHEANILIAEDVEMNMKLIKTLLTSLVPKANIYEATNGKEALDIYKKQRIDLIFMDVQMPIIDGLEATMTIREYESSRNEEEKTPIVALTAGAFSEDRDRCLKAGMLDFLAKPIVIKDLAEVLETYLS